MGFARGRPPRRDRSGVLDSKQPDECHTPRFARPSACRSRAGTACSSAGRQGTRALVSSCPYCAERRALAFSDARKGDRATVRSAASRRANRSDSRKGDAAHAFCDGAYEHRSDLCKGGCARVFFRPRSRSNIWSEASRRANRSDSRKGDPSRFRCVASICACRSGR